MGILVGYSDTASEWHDEATALAIEYMDELADDLHGDDPRVALSIDTVTIDVPENRSEIRINQTNFPNLDPDIFAGVTIGDDSTALSGPPDTFAATDLYKIICIPGAGDGTDHYCEITAVTDDENVVVTPGTPVGGGAGPVDARVAISGFVIYEHLGADDSANPVMKLVDARPITPDLGLFPNGATLIVTQGTDGVWHYRLVLAGP